MDIALPMLPGLQYAGAEIFATESQKVQKALHHLSSCRDCRKTLDITEAALVVNPFRIKGTRNYEWVKKLMSIFSNDSQFSTRQVDYFLRHLRKATTAERLQDSFDDQEAQFDCMMFTEDNKFDDKCECSICLEELKESQMIVKVKCCRHVFHCTCFKEWFKTKSTCPLCRQNLSKELEFDWCIHNVSFS